MESFSFGSFFAVLLYVNLGETVAENFILNVHMLGLNFSWFSIVNIIVTAALAPGISVRGIDYVDKVGPCLTWGRISTTCVMLIWGGT